MQNKNIFCTILATTLLGSPLLFAQESKHLTNITQITDGGDNAEAYWSFDNKNLTFQSNNAAWGLKCDQIFNLDIKKAKKNSSPK